MTTAAEPTTSPEAEAEGEAAFVAERARLHALLLQQRVAQEDGIEDGEGEGDDRVRYVRVKPCADDPGAEAEIHALLRTEAGATPLPWCPPHDPLRVWALPAAFRLAQWGPYQAGRVYGMDAASAAAVWALNPQPGEHVLDLCCAPGLKLSAIADALGGRGSITGVDINGTRLAVARKVAVKYKVGRPSCFSSSSPSSPPSSSLACRLLCADGVRFALGPLVPWDGGEKNVVFDSRAYDWQGMEARGQRRMNRGTRKKELLALRALLSQGIPAEGGGGMYDRVLVDSDCTHDGSARHLAKVAGLEASIQTRAGGFLSREKLAGLEALQRGLICNGFRLLRPGGTLVYSTCSLSSQQNEAVVSHLLATHPDTAVLDPITDLGRPLYDREGSPIIEGREEGGLPCRWGDIPGTLLFEPRFGTSGLFVARIRKRDKEGEARV